MMITNLKKPNTNLKYVFPNRHKAGMPPTHELMQASENDKVATYD